MGAWMSAELMWVHGCQLRSCGCAWDIVGVDIALDVQREIVNGLGI